MTMRTCLSAKHEAGMISDSGYKQITDMLDDFEEQFQERLGPSDQARRKAELATAEEFARQVARRRDLLARQVIAQKRVLTAADAHPKGFRAGVLSLLTRDWGGHNVNANVEYQRDLLRKTAHSDFVDGMQRFRPGLTGKSRDPAGMANVVRELFGVSTGDASASAIAKAWSETAEKLRLRFNDAGGDVGKLDDWRLPQTHDQRLIFEAKYEGWRDFVWDKLDRQKMIDFGTGLPMNDVRLETVLRDAYESLKTGGLDKIVPGSVNQERMKARKFDDAHRVLHFKDAEAFLEYHGRFGRGEIYGNLMAHIDRMANDIAWLEIMGPSPESTRRFLIDTIKQRAGREKEWNRMERKLAGISHIEHVWDDLSGLTATPVNARWAAWGANFRSYLQADLLGSASVSSLTDHGTMALTAGYNNLPVKDLFGMIPETAKMMASEGDKAFAAQLGFAADSWGRVLRSGARYAGEVFDQGIMGRINQTVMNASLLTPMTEARQMVFSLEFMGFFGRMRETGWEGLPAGLRRNMEQSGINREAWDIARSAPVAMREGAPFMDVKAIARLDNPRAREVAETFHRMVLTEQDHAVITSNARARAYMHQGTRAGTWIGEIARTFTMFKTFPLTMLSTHLMRGIGARTWEGKASYLAALAVTTGVYGLVSLQSKQVLYGKDMLDMSSGKTWGAALLQGGGLGIIGDFLFSPVNRFGQGPWTTLGGPAAGFLNDADRLVRGNAAQALAGEDMRLAYDVAKFAGRYTPGSSLWYGRLAMERLMIDQLALMDPKTRKGFRDLQRKAMRETGQEFWWPHGQTAPSRLPQMAEQP